MIDTHTHLYLKEFSHDIEEVMGRATEAGVTHFILPAIDEGENRNMELLEKKFPGKIFLMAGLHPCSVKENFEEELEKIGHRLSEREFAGIGESGMDLYWDETFYAQQIKSLKKHAEWAINYQKPLILHTRNAMDETINIIKEYSSDGLTGIFHCFSGNVDQANKIIEMGFLLGIGGVVTYKNSGLAEVISEIALKNIVLETDAPYLAPVPMRGKRNESSYLNFIAEKIALIKNISIEEVKNITSKNAEKIFQLPSHSPT